MASLLLPSQRPSRPADPNGRFDMSEVAKHKSLNDGWIVVDGKVYDITNFVLNHPGWTNGGQTSTVLAISRNLGRDCSEEFRAIHSPSAQALLPQYLVGELVPQGALCELTRELVQEVAWCCEWREASRLFMTCRAFRSYPWTLQLPSELTTSAVVAEGGGVFRKDANQAHGFIMLGAPIEALGSLAVEIITMRALRIFVGVRSGDGAKWTFDCAGGLHDYSGVRAFGDRVGSGSVVSMRRTESGVEFHVDGRSIGHVDITAKPLFPYITLENAPGDAVRLLGGPNAAPDNSAQCTTRRTHPLDGRLVVKMLGPDASDYFSFNLDPRTTTVTKLKRLLRIVLRARLGPGGLPTNADIDIIIHGLCVAENVTLAELGVRFIREAQTCDIYANLPHTVS